MQRTLFAIVLVGMIVVVLFVTFFFTLIVPVGSIFAAMITPPTPIPTPMPYPTPSPTPTPLVSGASAYMVDGYTGKVLFDLNSHARLPIASTTKIMTAVLTIESLNLDQYLTVQQDEIDEVPQGMSVAQLQVGDRIRVRDLLYGLLLPPGSDVAVVFAHAVAGTTANFVAMMNNKAHLLGLNDTHYANPYGYSDPNHYASAADLTILARYAMRIPVFAYIVTQHDCVLQATQHNHLYIHGTTPTDCSAYTQEQMASKRVLVMMQAIAWSFRQPVMEGFLLARRWMQVRLTNSSMMLKHCSPEALPNNNKA